MDVGVARNVLTSDLSIKEKKRWADEILGLESKLDSDDLRKMLGCGPDTGLITRAAFLGSRAHDIFLLNRKVSKVADLKLY